MRFWIEIVRGEWKWDSSLKGERGLNAPNKRRYLNFFSGIQAGDIALHYLAGGETSTKEKRSSIVGISRIDSGVGEEGFRLIVKISGAQEFRRPIKFSELKGIMGMSENFEKMVRTNMQTYLTEITRRDFEEILKIHPENKTVGGDFLDLFP